MNEQFSEFRRRVGRIDSAFERRVPGAFLVREDGLAIPKPRSRFRFYFPFKAVLASVLAVLLTKAFLITYFGEDAYIARMDALVAGSVYQEAAATLLMPDRVSLWASVWIGAAIALMPL